MGVYLGSNQIDMYGGQPSGGGGLEYEEGTWTPTEDVNRPTINFTNTHAEPPIFVMIIDATGTVDVTAYTNYSFYYLDWYRLTGVGIPYSSTAYTYGFWRNDGRSTSETGTTNSASLYSYSSDNAGATVGYPKYDVTNTGFMPSCHSTSRYWRVGRTYKWIAVWAPTA